VGAWPAVALVGSYEFSPSFGMVLRDVALVRHVTCRATDVYACCSRCW
jgi:hypothetical protein